MLGIFTNLSAKYSFRKNLFIKLLVPRCSLKYVLKVKLNLSCECSSHTSFIFCKITAVYVCVWYGMLWYERLSVSGCVCLCVICIVILCVHVSESEHVCVCVLCVWYGLMCECGMCV